MEDTGTLNEAKGEQEEEEADEGEDKEILLEEELLFRACLELLVVALVLVLEEEEEMGSWRVPPGKLALVTALPTDLNKLPPPPPPPMFLPPKIIKLTIIFRFYKKVSSLFLSSSYHE